MGDGELAGEGEVSVTSNGPLLDHETVMAMMMTQNRWWWRWCCVSGLSEQMGAPPQVVSCL